MTTKLKMLVSTLPLLFALAASSANASSYYNPTYDGNSPTNNCAAAHYQYSEDTGPYNVYQWSVPEMQDNTEVTVYGWTYDSSGRIVAAPANTFYCSEGTIYGGWGPEYPNTDSWW